MAVTSEVITVGTTAIQLTGSDDDSSFGQTLYVSNAGAADVLLGGPDVTTDAGYTLAAGDAFPWPLVLGGGETLYAVSATSSDVTVLRTGV